MKIYIKLSLLLLVVISSCTNDQISKINYSGIDYTKYVDPFIGTGGHAHNFPGAVVPFGMVQISPDTRMENWDGASGYHYSDGTIMGFSQTHLSGAGAPEFCDVLLMPTTGKVHVKVGVEEIEGEIDGYNVTSASASGEEQSTIGYRSKFSHDNEFASPGYYKVLLDDYNITAELTATIRTGFHRYTFPKSDSSNVIIDLLNRDRVIEANINIASDTEISGYRRSLRWAKDQHVYFYAEFSKPFSDYGIAIDDEIDKDIKTATGKNIKAFVTYSTSEGEEVLVKIGISSVSIEGAKRNLEAENNTWDFDGIRADTKELWKNQLAKIDIEGGTERERRIFYTALYHSAIAPSTFNDVDGSYRGVDRKTQKVEGFTRYTNHSLWDTFRAEMPLYTILEPSRMNDFIKSFLKAYEVAGRLPMWEIWGEKSVTMIGSHSLPVILDAYNKGIRDYDISLAYKAMKNEVEYIKYYSNMGYIPANKDKGSISKVMEYAYNDWCVAEMARNLGEEADYLKYQQRAQFYKNVFDESTGFMRPKNSDRTWVEPFDPAEHTEHFVEGNSYQYSLFAPQDINGLVDLIGGDKKFENWLDHFFTYVSKYDGESREAIGLIGQYAHGNEPSHQMVYLYNYVGAAPKTQKLAREILETLYDDKPDGITGNEDLGQMSAWYLLSSMGFYSVTPGSPVYAIGSPLFDKVSINLENGKQFVIETKNGSTENIYIQSATLNGKPYTKSWFAHSEIVNGGKFLFEMGATPNNDWGTSKDDRPHTQEFKAAVSIPYIVTDDDFFISKAAVKLNCETKGAKIYYTIDGSLPNEKSTLYTAPFQLTKTTNLKYAAYKEGLLPSVTVTEKFEQIEYETYKNYKGIKFKKGLSYKYYEGNMLFVKEFDDRIIKDSGVLPTFNIKGRKTDFYFGYIYDGYLEIPKDGKYTIYNKTNDGSILYIDGKEFINMDGMHGTYESFKIVALKKGIYKISQKYFQLAGGYMNRISWEGPGISKQEIPASALFHE